MSDEEYDYEEEKTPRRKKRRLWPIFLVLILVVIFFLPNLILMTPLKNSVIESVTSDVNGKVAVDQVSAGWFSSVRLSGVHISDPDGNEVISANSVHTNKSLWSFLTDANLGAISVNQPSIKLSIRNGGSNIEDLFANYLKAESTGAATPTFEITIEQGSVALTNSTDNSETRLAEVQGVVKFDSDTGLDIVANGREPEIVESSVEITCQLPPVDKQFSYREGKLQAQTKRANSSILGAVFTRIGYSVSMTGWVSGTSRLSWTDHFGTLETEFENVTYDRAMVSAPDYIGKDQITLQRVQANGTFGLSGNQASTKNLLVQSDVGSIQAKGIFDLAQLSNLLTKGRFAENDFQVSGAVDIAALARMLPNTIHLHDEVQVDSGKLTFQSFSRIEGINRRLMLNAEIQSISGRRQGQSFRWQQPIRVTATARQNETETIIEDANVRSASIQVSGSGSLKQADFTAKGDLGQLANDLRQFIDLGRTRLSGQFAGRLRWTPSTDSTAEVINRPMDLQTSFRFANADIHFPNVYQLKETTLDFQLHARGQLGANGGVHVETGTGILTANDDQLKFQLNEAIKNLSLQSSLVGHADLKGQASRWHNRFKPFLPKHVEFRTSGKTNISADVSVSMKNVYVKNINGTLEQFAFDGYGLAIREPKIVLGGQFAIDLQKSQLQIPDATLSSSSIAARTNNAKIEFGKDLRVVGTTAFRANVGRISQWIPALNKSSLAAQGTAEGNATIEAQGSRFNGQIDSTIKNLRVADRNKQNEPPIWSESAAKVGAKFSTSDFDQFVFDNIAIQSKALALDAKGTIKDVSQEVHVDLSGRWQPDWKVISGIASSMSGQKISVQGNSMQTFTARGPLFQVASRGTPATTASATKTSTSGWISPELVVESKLAWQNAEIMGFPLGQAAFPVSLQKQYLASEQVKMKIGAGEIDLRPGLDMRYANPVIHLRNGSVAKNIQLTPETCAGFLKYIAPPVADATRAQGSFSVTTSNVQLPMNNPLNGLAAGTVEIQKATLQSGPLADQILGLAKSIKQLTHGGNVINNLLNQNGGGLLNATPQQTQTWVVMPAQKIPFQMQKGRVYHEGATFQIDDVTIKTRGSVGADQSMQLVAAIPILDKWIAGKSWMQSLKGQSIQVPIKGTLSKPQLDANVMRQLSQQFLRQNLGNTLQQKATDRLNREIQKNLGGELEKGLKKLFGK